MSGAPGARVLFDLVFFIVVIGSLLPGATVPWVTRKLKLDAGRPAAAPMVIAIDGPDTTKDLRAFFMEPELAVVGASLESLPLPAGAAVTMLDRAGTMIPATPSTVIRPGDQVYILYLREDESEIALLFGQPI
jgi:cell volume regulation protein A